MSSDLERKIQHLILFSLKNTTSNGTKEINNTMESKLNYSFIQDYSHQYVQSIIDAFFNNNEKISGPEILKLCRVNQVNLLVIKKLLEVWQQETHKLESPYFDYDNAKVKEALETFMNTLSQHIAISRKHFEPLLEQAVSDTILLIFSPYDYYVRELTSSGKETLTLEILKKDLRYIKINRPILDAFIKRFEDEELAEVQGDEKIRIFNEVFENLEEAPEDFDEYVNIFSETLALPVDKLYTNPSAQNEEQEDVRPTLNDQFSNTNADTLADLHQKKKIDNIKEHINVNQKFMFTKTLFGDSKDEFEKAIENLENYSSYVDAFNYLRRDFAGKYHWQMDSEEVIEFLELVAKKY